MHCTKCLENDTFQFSDVIVTRNQPKNGFKARWTRLFFIFYQIFGIFDDFSKFQSIYQCNWFWKIIKSAKILAKNEEKPCSTCIIPISPWHCMYPNPGFRVPVLLLILLRERFLALNYYPHFHCTIFQFLAFSWFIPNSWRRPCHHGTGPISNVNDWHPRPLHSHRSWRCWWSHITFVGNG